MKVLVYTDPGVVHSQRFLRSLSRRAAVGLYWRSGKPPCEIEGMRRYSFYPIPFVHTFRTLRRAQAVFSMRAALGAFQPDIFHAHVDPLVFREVKKIDPTLPCIFTAWGHIPAELLHGSYGEVLRLADAIVSDSEAVLEEIREGAACANTTTHLFRFGVDQESFTRVPVDESLLRALGIPSRARIIFSPRSQRAPYNHETLLRAMPCVLQSEPDAVVLFLNAHGHRYKDAPEYTAGLKRTAETLGVANRIYFMDHHVDRLTMAMLYSAADITVSIPVEDAFPATIFEAMACGSPLVVSALPDYRGVITGQNAISVAPRNVEELAQALEVLLLGEDRRSSILHHAAITVKTMGSIEPETTRLLDLYEQKVKRLGTAVGV